MRWSFVFLVISGVTALQGKGRRSAGSNNKSRRKKKQEEKQQLEIDTTKSTIIKGGISVEDEANSYYQMVLSPKKSPELDGIDKEFDALVAAKEKTKKKCVKDGIANNPSPTQQRFLAGAYDAAELRMYEHEFEIMGQVLSQIKSDVSKTSMEELENFMEQVQEKVDGLETYNSEIFEKETAVRQQADRIIIETIECMVPKMKSNLKNTPLEKLDGIRGQLRQKLDTLSMYQTGDESETEIKIKAERVLSSVYMLIEFKMAKDMVSDERDRFKDLQKYVSGFENGCFIKMDMKSFDKPRHVDEGETPFKYVMRLFSDMNVVFVDLQTSLNQIEIDCTDIISDLAKLMYKSSQFSLKIQRAAKDNHKCYDVDTCRLQKQVRNMKLPHPGCDDVQYALDLLEGNWHRMDHFQQYRESFKYSPNITGKALILDDERLPGENPYDCYCRLYDNMIKDYEEIRPILKNYTENGDQSLQRDVIRFQTFHHPRVLDAPVEIETPISDDEDDYELSPDTSRSQRILPLPMSLHMKMPHPGGRAYSSAQNCNCRDCLQFLASRPVFSGAWPVDARGVIHKYVESTE